MFKQLLKKDGKKIPSMLISPIVGLLIVGFLCSKTYIDQIPLAILDMDNSSLSKTIISSFEKHPGFGELYFVDSVKELEATVYKHKAAAGLILPENYGEQVAMLHGPKAMLLLDGTNTSFSGTAQGYASAIFGELNAGFKIEAMQKGGISNAAISQMTGKFSFAVRDLYDPYGRMLYTLIYMILCFMIQRNYICDYLLPVLWEEREKGWLTWKNHFMLQRIGLMMTVTSLSTYLALIIGHFAFNLPFSSNFFAHFILMFVYLCALSAVSFVLSIVTTKKAKVYIFELFCLISTLLVQTSGATWPMFLMPTWLTVLIKLIWPFSAAVGPFKALHMKNIGWVEILPACGEMLIFAVFWLLIGAFIKTYLPRILGKNKAKAQELAEVC